MGLPSQKKESMYPLLECDTCSKNFAIGITISRMLPVEFKVCQECLEKEAEPIYLFEYLYSKSQHHVVYFLKYYEDRGGLCSFRDGKYIEANELMRLLESKHKTSIAKPFIPLEIDGDEIRMPLLFECIEELFLKRIYDIKTCMKYLGLNDDYGNEYLQCVNDLAHWNKMMLKAMNYFEKLPPESE